jgi:hypothetical protein
MTGMLAVNLKMKTMDPKEVKASLEQTNRLIQTLAGDK